MEKKNTILLTVIAIATLLVAVVGATFAYFTASITTTNGNNATSTITTYALASAKMNMGDKLEATGVYPGYKAVKTVTVTGSCPSGLSTCDPVQAVISVIPSIPTEFGTDISWKLYKSTSAITCTTSPVSDNGKYYDNGTCTYPSNSEAYSVVAQGDRTQVDKQIPVTSTTNDTYYLVVEYNNDTANPQNTEQGKTYSVTLDFKPVSTVADS